MPGIRTSRVESTIGNIRAGRRSRAAAWSPVPTEGDALAYMRSLGGARFTVFLNSDDIPKSVRAQDPISGRIILSTHERKTDFAFRQDLELAANEGLLVAM
jgi:alpha-glucosidase